ncbi:hypothetical protein [Hymenobacter sp. GOD-10R]|uniref:hypothetical protein n=1 Tax=Hymenobacter sp. GOD-10R TaxID=3093922 RepID=UPI002D797DB6|nr:hypothetical protein [Hymenobacter sp. GOD-10R]WRQ28713.1 hypothetical protein SD425_00350 [Hymenobacter sp. GOD-10R]
MKTLSTFRSLVLVPSLSLLGYANDAPKEVVKTADTHVVQVRVMGQNLDGLGAELSVRSVLDWSPRSYKPGPTLSRNFDKSINETYTIGTFGEKDYVEASISFKNVMFHNNIRPSANTQLRVEIITDGKVGEKTRLDANALNDKVWRVEYDPYMKGTVTVETNKL